MNLERTAHAVCAGRDYSLCDPAGLRSNLNLCEGD